MSDANAVWRRIIDDNDDEPTERWNPISTHLTRLTEDRPKGWWYWRAAGHMRVRLGHPDQGVTDYGKAIDIRPDDGWSWLARGLARKNLNRLEPAPRRPHTRRHASGTERVVEPRGVCPRRDSGHTLLLGRSGSRVRSLVGVGEDSTAIPWYFHAALRLYSGDKPGYRRACHAMLERFGKTRDPFVASLAAHACSLGVDSGVDASRIVELAEQASRDKPQDCWSLYTLAAALRRAGRLDTALARLEQAVRVNPEWTCTPLIASRPRAERDRSPGACEQGTRASRDERKSINRHQR